MSLPRAPIPGAPEQEAHPDLPPGPAQVRPRKRWYWVGGLIFPVTLLFGVLLLAPEEDSPAEIVFGVVTPVLGFFASVIALVIVLVVRSINKAGLRAPRPAYPPPGAYAPHTPYGPYGAAPVYQAPPPPKVDPALLRPNRRWYWIGGAMAPVGIAAGVLTMMSLFSSATGVPDFVGVAESQGSVVFEVAEGEEEAWGLWVTPEDASYHYMCDLVGSTSTGYPFGAPSVPYSSEGWKLAATIETPAPGTYTLECDGDPGVSYAVGDQATAEAADSRMALGVFAMFGLSFLGVVAAVATVLITLVRRVSSHDRLRREALAGAMAPPAPAGYRSPPSRGAGEPDHLTDTPA